MKESILLAIDCCGMPENIVRGKILEIRPHYPAIKDYNKLSNSSKCSRKLKSFSKIFFTL